MNIYRLKCFISVAKNLSFTKAGEECFLAQTAVSRHISAIEEELGVVLFERNNRQVKLTAVGEYFYKEFSTVVEKYDNAITQGKKMMLNGKDTIKIGIGQYERYFVSPLVREFLAEFPSVEVTIEQHLYKDLTKHLKSGEIDVIFALPIISKYAEAERISIKKLFSSKTILAVSQNHPLAKQEKPKKEDYSKYPLITIGEDEGPCSIQALQGITAGIGIYPQKYIKVNTLEAGLLMVEANIGMMFLPDFLYGQLTDTLKHIETTKEDDSYFACLYMPNNTNSTLELFIKGISMSKTLSVLRGDTTIN